jgi:hypothetical protein
VKVGFIHNVLCRSGKINEDDVSNNEDDVTDFDTILAIFPEGLVNNIVEAS